MESCSNLVVELTALSRCISCSLSLVWKISPLERIQQLRPTETKSGNAFLQWLVNPKPQNQMRKNWKNIRWTNCKINLGWETRIFSTKKLETPSQSVMASAFFGLLLAAKMHVFEPSIFDTFEHSFSNIFCAFKEEIRTGRQVVTLPRERNSCFRPTNRASIFQF